MRSSAELVKTEVMDRSPDIQDLFAHYNSLYFDDALGSCVVSWSSSPMKRSAGICKYREVGCCEIHLSEPSLRHRSADDLKNTLLHEMIHAFLWIQKEEKNHNDHGPSFRAIMKSIIFSSVTDHQRPSGGYKITTYHMFQEEVESSKLHQWICESCGDWIKRKLNREPSATDCPKKMGPVLSCSCHWHSHKMSCSGIYTKIAQPVGYIDKRATKGKQGQEQESKRSSYTTRQTTKRLRHTKETKDNPDNKSSKAVTNPLPALCGSSRDSGNGSPAISGSKRAVNCLALMDIDSNTESPTEVPKRPRTTSVRKQHEILSSTEKKKSRDPKDQCPVYSAWLNYYAIEESDEDIEPLIDRRLERRKKEKQLKLLKGKNSENLGRTSHYHASSYDNKVDGHTDHQLLGYRYDEKQRQDESVVSSSKDVFDDVIDVSDG